MNDFLIRITLLFLPGIIAFIIIDKFTNHRELKNRDIFLYIFILGFFSYVVFYLCVVVKSFVFNGQNSVKFFESLVNPNNTLDFKEILWASLAAIIIGFALTWLISRDTIYRVARFFRITKEFGHPSVFDNLMDVEDNRAISIWNEEKNKLYYGWVKKYSTLGDYIELSLEDVKAYRIEDNIVVGEYSIQEVYLLRKKDNLDISLEGQSKEGV